MQSLRQAYICKHYLKHTDIFDQAFRCHLLLYLMQNRSFVIERP